MLVIAVVAIKGGSGKTHATVHLAAEASRRQKTAVLDLDPSRQAADWIELAGLGIPALHLDIRTQDLEGYVAQLRAEADFEVVIIDTPANDRDAALLALDSADLALVPVGVGTSDVGQLATTERLVRRAQKLRPELKAFVLINRAKFAPARERETVAEVERSGLPILKARIPLRAEYQAAAGRPLTGFHYGEVWAELIGERA